MVVFNINFVSFSTATVVNKPLITLYLPSLITI